MLSCRKTSYLKAVKQHMANAGPDDPWAEAGVFAANTTETMPAGKA